MLRSWLLFNYYLKIGFFTIIKIKISGFNRLLNELLIFLNLFLLNVRLNIRQPKYRRMLLVGLR
jgi:hypothetical protein